MKVLKQVVAKGKNVRIIIELHQEDDIKGFLVHTKRLIDFSKRKIVTSTVHYSIETFLALVEISNVLFLQDDFIINKVLLSELHKISKENKFKVKTWVND